MKKANRILLVDDDADDQLYFRDAINEINPQVSCHVASNGQEALDKIVIPPPPDVIFLDLNMPVMNGYECLSALRKEKEFKDIPVVIFTTSKNEKDIEKSKKLGATLFFTKPSNFSTLCTKLNKILEMDFSEQHFAI